MHAPIRLLYAEDNPQDADLTRTRFAELGPEFALEIVGSAAHCLRRLVEQSFDLLLLDNRLPDLDGLDTLVALRQRGDTIPVVMVTATGDDETVARALRAGAVDYVPKADDYLATLPEILRCVLKRSRTHRALAHLHDQRRRVVLYIEPNAMDAELTHHHFEATAPHLHLHVVSSCLAALPLLTPNHGFDLVLTDLRVPGMDALEFIREAMHRGVEVPFIVITGRGDESTAVALLRLGASDYIVKRENYLTQLPHAIEHALQRHQLDVVSQRLHADLAALNADLEQRVADRTAELRREVEERRRAEERIRSLASFPELNPNPVLAFDETGTVIYANSAIRELARSIGSDTPEAVLPPGTVGLVQTCLATGTPLRHLETKVGPHTISWSFHPIEDTRRVHCYSNDISARILLEEKLRQSQKMEAIGHLAGGIAHDFNNLLTVIQGNNTLLQLPGTSDAQRAEALSEVAQACERAAALTRQLLAFSRRQPMSPRCLNLNEIVRGISQMLRRLLGENIALQLMLHPQPLPTVVDAGMMDQVILNLAVNARDAMPDGGRLTLTTALRSIAPGKLELEELAAGDYVALVVTDTGTGIAAEHLPHIFEPFFTTKAPGKGTGLGLATVFGIVKQHGGRIRAIDPPERGAGFEILLPMADARLLVSGSAGTAPLPPGGGETIIVVEDEPAVRRLVQRALESRGYTVHAFFSGAEALERGLDRCATADLVITDMIMPGGFTGQQVIAAMQQRRPNLKSIFMSGYTGDIAGPNLSLHEGCNFLQKPFTTDALLRCVRANLDGTAGPPTAPAG